MPASGLIRVLVVDDSALVRRTIAELLARDPSLKIVGTAADGLEAIARIRDLRPDVVTLDVMMPRLDGLKVLAGVMRENPVRVIMLSSLTREGAEVTLQALDLGAVDFVDKTALAESDRDSSAGEELIAKIHAVAAVNLKRLGERRPGPLLAAVPPPVPAHRAEALVIGASTGGPPALQRIIPALPGDLAAGIVVVQHIPQGFTRPLAGRLDASSALAVREAAAGDLVRPGEVLIAPGGIHLTFERRGDDVAVVLGLEPRDSRHRPSVDVTMESAAEAWGPGAAGVLLTGMGSDGALGLLAIRAAGGRTLAESEETAVVYGMPRAAMELGAVQEALPLERIAEGITRATARRE